MPASRNEPDTQVAIIGTGFSGLAMANRLKKAGRHDFVIFEKAAEVGGTWRENTYPGAACDVPSHMYSFSFAPNPRWTRAFSPQPEILAYLRRTAEEQDILRHVRFETPVTSAVFDEITDLWTLTTGAGEQLTARSVVAGLGGLHVPEIPHLDGIEKFKGSVFHSASWDHSCDLSSKRVAVIGTGASAIQIVPAIAAEVQQLHLFQRTAPWVLPKGDRALTSLETRSFTRLPLLQRLNRTKIYWQQEARILGLVIDPRLMKPLEALARAYMRTQIDDPVLRKKVTPGYTMGCKRILLSNDYYAALNRPDVDVVTDGILEVRDHSIITTDGTEIEVDVIVYGTGFKVSDLGPLNVIGRDALSLREVWEESAEAYLGTSIVGFPNFYYLVGPNVGLGHNSIVFMAEAQADHVVAALDLMEETGHSRIEVTRAAQETFNKRIQAKLAGTVWSSGGCSSWYLDKHGKNTTLWPGFTATFRRQARRIDRNAYRVGNTGTPTPVDHAAVA